MRLSSIVAVLLLSLSACGGASTSDSAAPAGSSAASGNTSGQAAAPTKPPMAGAWTGTLVGKANTINDAVIRFSAAGSLIYEYTVRGGETRSVEWTEQGQQLQYLPPGGGVQKITIEAFDRAPGRLSLTQRWVHEQSGGQILDQSFLVSKIEFEVVPEGLRMTMANATERYMNGNPTGGEQDTFTGVLKPQAK